MNKTLRMIIISIALILNTLIINQMKYRNDELYAVNLKNKIDKDLVSILVSDGSENYVKYEGDSFPSNTEYTYNSELSKCQDNNGNVIEGILSYNEERNMISVKTNKTTYCYLYFDKKSGGVEITGNLVLGLTRSDVLWESGLEGDGYRYTGSGDAESSTSPNNFICFGTSNLSECKAYEEKYMYRIIGAFPDVDGQLYLKLIKYKSIGNYDWHSDDQTDVPWDRSDLFMGLNGYNSSNLFIGNIAYEYLQDNKWLNKIVDWDWTATNTLTFTDAGPDYMSITTEQMYLHEMGRTVTGECYSYFTEESCDFNIGDWINSYDKIGLMYASDYMMSLGRNSLTMTSYSDYETLKTGWLNPSNNDSSSNLYGWLISRAGLYPDMYGYCAWTVDDGGSLSLFNVREYETDVSLSMCPDSGCVSPGVFPVFYLDPSVEASGGTGSYSNPYLIVN